MMKALSASIAIAALAAASPALASPKAATYTGFISSGTDVDGLFGAAGTDLTGLGFSVVYRYDTEVGRRLTNLPSYDSLDGPAGSLGNPMSEVVLTIGGVSKQISFDFYGFAATYPAQSLVEHEVIGDYDQYNLMYNFLYTSVASLDVNVPLQSGSGGGLFRIGHGSGGAETIEASGVFDTRTLVITGDVPEPISWSLMIAGFGLVGTAMRITAARSRMVAT